MGTQQLFLFLISSKVSEMFFFFDLEACLVNLKLPLKLLTCSDVRDVLDGYPDGSGRLSLSTWSNGPFVSDVLLYRNFQTTFFVTIITISWK